MHRLAEVPALGHVRADVDDEKFLFFVVHRYVIAYVRDTSPLRIERVIHGSRDFRQIFF
jgi:antitoxin ParD1/3/4/toxin ParE1/3/4